MHNPFAMQFFGLVVVMVLSLCTSLSAQPGHHIQFKIKDFSGDTLLIAYHLIDKQYLQDTLLRAKDDTFTMQGEEPLAPGIYLAVLPPDNSYFQFLITPDEQRFSLTTEKEKQVGRIKFKDAPDNTLFYDYLAFLESKRPQGEALAKSVKETSDEAEKATLQQRMQALNEEVSAYQQRIIQEHPAALTAAIVRANLAVNPPTYDQLPDSDARTAQWRWMQQHYFDNLDLADPRLLRTPFFYERINYFVHKLQVQHPDTLSRAMDEVLTRLAPTPDNFKMYLIHFINEAAKSKLVGMDAVYVHLVDNYYAKGKASWTDSEQLDKMVKNADELRPTLIGKTAHDIRMQRRDGSSLSLHEVEAPFTILYFWRYDCGHCKESTPIMKEFYEKYRDKGVKIFSVCTKNAKEIDQCWEYVDDNDLGEWIQVVDPYMRSLYGVYYDIKTTPKIYILDRDKKIVSKGIGAEQLDELMQHLLEQAGTITE